jgi:hypothetical protein
MTELSDLRDTRTFFCYVLAIYVRFLTWIRPTSFLMSSSLQNVGYEPIKRNLLGKPPHKSDFSRIFGLSLDLYDDLTRHTFLKH